MSAPLIRLSSPAIFLPDPNVDTDIIFPARFLLKIDREGMEECLFHDRRIDANGVERPEHPFNRSELRHAQVLIAGPGFGGGSSREHAVWALVDWGIRLVIAPDFGDIFAGNAAKNGLLVLRLPQETCEALGVKAEAGALFELDLPERRLSVAGEEVCRIDLDDAVARALMEGWDEIDVILNDDMGRIRAFERGHRDRQPWLFLNG